MAIWGYFVGILSFGAAYMFGRDVAAMIRRKSSEQVTSGGRSAIHILTTILLITAFTVLTVLMLIDLPESNKAMVLSLIFAPFAACIRYRLKRQRAAKQRFPVGTLLVNLIGIVLVASLHVIATRLSPYNCQDESIMCWPNVIVFAFDIGFCGTLTTISDVSEEFFDVKMQGHDFYAYMYIVSTLITSQLLAGVINGINYSYL